MALTLLGAGSALLARDAYMRAKALCAEVLIGRAFAAHLKDGGEHRPWTWADTHPIARLEVARLGVRRYVLASASGESLAFGIGHLDGTAPPNVAGNCVLTGHRDTWLAFLKDLVQGDELRLRTREGERGYVVDRIEVLPRTASAVLDPSLDERLTLVTCYPFDGPLRTPWRFVVTCRPEGWTGGLAREGYRHTDRERSISTPAELVPAGDSTPSTWAVTRM